LNFQSCFKKETDGTVTSASASIESAATNATTKPPMSEAEVEEERAEKEFKRKQRLGSNITFIGELYLRQLLRPMIVHLVIRSLLEEDSEGNLGRPDAQQLELSVKLLTTIEGFKLYEEEAVMAMRYFEYETGDELNFISLFSRLFVRYDLFVGSLFVCRLLVRE
jgi:hypothetical protein